jgi:hypothetical protein
VIDMNSHGDKLPDNRDAAEIGTWENEGGSVSRDSMDHHYGRRVEADRSWTVYHVFTGVPADVGGRTMIGLGRAAATEGMMSLNLRNAGRRKERVRLNPPQLDAREEVPAWR